MQWNLSYLQEHTTSTCQQDTRVYILTFWLVWPLPAASGEGWLLRLGAGALRAAGFRGSLCCAAEDAAAAVPASPRFLPRRLLSPVASESEATGGAFAGARGACSALPCNRVLRLLLGTGC